MWKIAVGFAVFAGLALYVISQGGDNIDMTGEKHGAEAVHVPAPAEAPAAPLLHLHPQASNLGLEVGPTNGVRSTLISNQVGAKANGG